MTKFLNISTDNTLGGNSPSNELVASQKAIKEYVDNNSGSIATGITNKNTESGATNPIYDWVGTLQEYNDQDIENQHPDWICYITDDVSGGTSVYTKTEVDSLLALKVSTGHEVIEYQAPTAENNYMWYRKYKDGWVEQGCSSSLSGGNAVQITLPVSCSTYTVLLSTNSSDTNNVAYKLAWYDRLSTGFKVMSMYSHTTVARSFFWMACGMAE